MAGVVNSTLQYLRDVDKGYAVYHIEVTKECIMLLGRLSRREEF